MPGAEPRKIEKALQSCADTLLLDLEDSVPLDRKAEARSQVSETLRSRRDQDKQDKEIAVRINATDSLYFEADLEAILEAGASAILLPKAESAEQVTAVAKTLDASTARRKGRAVKVAEEGEDHGTPNVELLALVETPLGVANALAIATCTPHVQSLCFGHADFSLQMGLREADASRGVVYHARCSLVLSAKAAGATPIDSVHLAVRDEAAFRDDAELGASLGFEGKLCIHPRQAELANEVYTPGAEEIDYALRVVKASRSAEAEGRGVFTLDGKMIDAPLVAVQARVLERARRAGSLSD